MKKSILFILFLLLISYSVFGQITVSGRVVDGNGEPIIGFIIKVKDTLQGTVTDADGKFTIDVKDENTILVFKRHNTDKPLELKASEIDQDIIWQTTRVIASGFGCVYRIPIITVYKGSLDINYWSGLFYNPYGIMVSKGFYSNKEKEKENRTYFLFEAGYSTNFKGNVDFYGSAGTDLLGQHIYYTFQQTAINKLETENKITTHLLESSTGLKYFGVMYGIGYQQFQRKGIENSLKKNWGANIGIAKSIKYVGILYFKSFYWQDYWAWETNLNKEFYYRKLRLSTAISYRQTTQDFKEVNLTLGYIF